VSAEQDAMIQAAFAELRVEFAGKLPDRIEAVSRAIRAAGAAREDGELRDAARSVAHKLRGSAGSYGFPEISAAAGRIEEAFVDLRGEVAADPAASWRVILEALAELERTGSES
jgi:HPt (histidine-containing phosphotransfer) domain-containing protein